MDQNEKAKVGVYRAIVAATADLAKEGILKLRRNNQGAGFDFRGIDDVYNALAPVLAKNGICVFPRMLNWECRERTSKKGDPLFFVKVEAEFDFVSAEDGSMHTARTIGEAMDSGDKGTNKAMSAAYKYAAFQVFCIPTEGDHDSENTTFEVQSEYITAEDVEACRADLLLAGGNEVAFCKYLGIDSLDKIQKKNIPSVKAAIQWKKDEKAKKDAGEKK